MDFWDTVNNTLGAAGQAKDIFGKPDPVAPVVIVEEPAIDPMLLALGAAALLAIVLAK